MKQIGQDPNIKLVDEDAGNMGSKKVESYTRKVTKDLFEE